MNNRESQGPDEEMSSITIRPARHTAKTKKADQGSDISGEFYPGITPEGETKVREIASTEILEMIEQAEPGAIVVFSGTSDYSRTKSTSRVSGNEIKKLLDDRKEEFLVLDEGDINSLAKNKEEQSTIHELQKLAHENPSKKIVLTYPLSLTEFSMDTKTAGREKDVPKWKSGGNEEVWSPALTEIMKQANNDEAEAVKLWIRTGGKVTDSEGNEIQGPDPKHIAENYKKGMERLIKVNKKLFPGRPVVILPTAHSWDMDVFIVSMTHNGEVTEEGFEEIAKGTGEKVDIIGSYEAPLIKFDSKGQGTVEYRGKTYSASSLEV